MAQQCKNKRNDSVPVPNPGGTSGTPNPIEPGHLFRRSAFENPGAYYVMIEHGWTGDVEYTLFASGSGLGR